MEAAGFNSIGSTRRKGNVSAWLRHALRKNPAAANALVPPLLGEDGVLAITFPLETTMTVGTSSATREHRGFSTGFGTAPAGPFGDLDPNPAVATIGPYEFTFLFEVFADQNGALHRVSVVVASDVVVTTYGDGSVTVPDAQPGGLTLSVDDGAEVLAVPFDLTYGLLHIYRTPLAGSQPDVEAMFDYLDARVGQDLPVVVSVT